MTPVIESDPVPIPFLILHSKKKVLLCGMSSYFESGCWILLSLAAVAGMAFFYRGLNRSFEKNAVRALLLIVVSFLCGIMMMAVSLYHFSAREEKVPPPSGVPSQHFLD